MTYIRDLTVHSFHCMDLYCWWSQGTLRWHNGYDSLSNHQPLDCLLNLLFRCRSKKTSKLRVTGLWARNSPVTGEFPAQRASNAENVSIWWRHHGQSAMLPAFKTISYSPEIRGCFLYIGSDHVIKTSVNEIMHIMSTGTLFQMKLHFVGIFVYNHKPVISKIISGIHSVSISCEIALRWMLCKTSLMIRWYWHHGTKPLPEPMFYDAIWHHQVTTS